MTIVGDLERPDHYHLPMDAKCYFWGEYTPRRHTQGPAWDFSETNQLISNFKKKLDRQHLPDWRYKQQAIQTIGNALSKHWDWPALHSNGIALIPMPPSRPRNDQMYDDRMLQVLESVRNHTQLALDIRDCLSFSGAYAASHETDDRPTPDQLYQDLTIDVATARVKPLPNAILLFDDMLTTGAHFVAAHRRLQETFGEVQVVGCYVCRRRLPNPFGEL
ncbi:hypothetical protein [Chromobacterium vaccinii]|uniref:hypothetical protein n=1 Tax=Chromobacterium vaccinii TaxID=1108595 RepID=UPI001185A87A|nr:hypothetical protein [Chromobacterium vaccinii]